ncbi:MAG TPA: hypothetical protein VJU86_19770 [Pyrinomonadaceae bacterium]|nr:hypothetical protein [Pyrinomonadaceae bacterium]
MAEERTLGIARARETWDEEPTKEELQRRMDQARDSITNTVSEIKDNVAQQVETVKDALDWREHFKKQPLAWSLGAAGVGFFVGYGIAAAIKGDDDTGPDYLSESPGTYARSLTRESLRTPIESNGKDDGPGMLERFKETSAYERLSKEAGTIGDRVIEELSSTAQAVVLPFLLNKIKNWVGLDLSEKPASMTSAQPSRQISHEASFEKSREF